MPNLKSKWMVAENWGKIWVVKNKQSGKAMGDISYNAGWKEWEFNPNEEFSYTHKCLSDLAAFLAELNRER